MLNLEQKEYLGYLEYVALQFTVCKAQDIFVLLLTKRESYTKGITAQCLDHMDWGLILYSHIASQECLVIRDLNLNMFWNIPIITDEKKPQILF